MVKQTSFIYCFIICSYFLVLCCLVLNHLFYFSMLRANNFCNLSSKSLFLQLKISKHSISSPPCTKSTECYRLSSVNWHEIAPSFLKKRKQLALIFLGRWPKNYARFHYFNGISMIRIVYISLCTWAVKDFMVSGSPGIF